jgi:serine/threonine protein kinase
MEIRGQELVKLLLEAYMELEKSDVRIRSIQPSNTFVSNNYDKVTFADISASCQRNTTASREVGVIEPYSSIGFINFRSIPDSSPFWDRWSIGIMILEIIIGSDLLIENSTFKYLKEFWLDCYEYLDSDTFDFLNCMLF